MRPFSVLNKSRCLNITRIVSKRNQDKETLENVALLWSTMVHHGSNTVRKSEFGLPDPGPRGKLHFFALSRVISKISSSGTRNLGYGV